jgi:hypothetical protein
MPRLIATEYASSSLLDPTSYPGRASPDPVLLLDDDLLPLEALHGLRLGTWMVGELDTCALPVLRDAGANRGKLDDVLLDDVLPGEVAPADSRYPILAVGSNASPGQVHRKFGMAKVSTIVPMVPVEVDNLAVGHSAHVSTPGYVPAAPFAARGEVAQGHLLWLDPQQMQAMNDTEPNYRPLRLSPEYPARLPSGEVLTELVVYVSKHELLAGELGPRRLTSQRELLAALLEDVEFAAIFDGEPDATAVLAANAEVRDRLKTVFRTTPGVVPHGLETTAEPAKAYGEHVGTFPA